MPGAQILCPGCGHPAREHVETVGCVSGWTVVDDIPVDKGCRCKWVHVDVFSTESEWTGARS